MPDSPELKFARDLVFQGMGRNLIHFQRLELMLKHLLGRYQGSVTLGTKECDVKQRQAAAEKKTLGLLAGELFEDLIVKNSEDDGFPTHLFRPGKITYRASIGVTEESHAAGQTRLKGLIEERNQMVHTSLLTMDLQTIEGCQAAVAQLDAQRGRIQTEFEWVEQYNELVTLSAKQFLETLSDPEFLKNLGPSIKSGRELESGRTE